MSDDCTPLKELALRCGALRDNAYLEYIAHCRREECLGWKAKLALGQFGSPELEAHELSAEWLGKHMAYARIAEEISKLLEKGAK